MSEFLKYREEARLKYEKQKKLDEEIRREKENMIKKEMDKKREEEEIHSHIYSIFQNWDNTLANFYTEPIFTLYLLNSIISSQTKWNISFVELLEKYDRTEELQSRVVDLVHLLNTYSEKKNERNIDLSIINEIYKIMKDIIRLSKTDIPIEVMDTENDEKLCRELQEKEDKLFYDYDYNDFPNLNIPNEDIRDIRDISDISDITDIEEKKEINNEDENIPTVYLSSREGLRLIDMKELAKKNGIAIYGTKQVLAKRLEEKGLVRVII